MHALAPQRHHHPGVGLANLVRTLEVGEVDVLQQIAALRKLTVAGLRQEYLKLFGEESNSRNKVYLFRRIAYRIQEKKYGGLSQRAKDKAKELAKDAPIRRRLLGNGPELDIKRDPRLPKPGSLLMREFKGKAHEVKVLKDAPRKVVHPKAEGEKRAREDSYRAATVDVRNAGDRTIEELELWVYFLNAKGEPHFLEKEGSNKPARPNYTWAHPVMAGGAHPATSKPLAPGESRTLDVDVPETFDDPAWVNPRALGAQVRWVRLK